MLPRERVLAAIDHRETDRVPVDLWAEEPVWERLLADLGLKSRDALLERLERQRALRLSGLSTQRRFQRRETEHVGRAVDDGQHALGQRLGARRRALANVSSLDEIAAFAWPSCDQVDYSGLAEQCDKYQGYAIAYGNADIFERPALVRGWENFLCDTSLNPDWVDFILKKFLDFFVEDFTRCLQATGGRINVFFALTDLGTQAGLLQSRKMFQRFIAPPIKILAEQAHRNGVKFMFHSCGSVRELIPDLIELGVDILNPIQPAAVGMEPEGLKRDFGSRLCFHGGIDIQYLLPLEPAEAVRKEVQRRVKILGRGGGYILAPSHNLQQDISTENIVAMYETALRAL